MSVQNEPRSIDGETDTTKRDSFIDTLSQLQPYQLEGAVPIGQDTMTYKAKTISDVVLKALKMKEAIEKENSKGKVDLDERVIIQNVGKEDNELRYSIIRRMYYLSMDQPLDEKALLACESKLTKSEDDHRTVYGYKTLHREIGSDCLVYGKDESVWSPAIRIMMRKDIPPQYALVYRRLPSNK